MLLVSDPEDSLDGEQDALTPRAPRQVLSTDLSRGSMVARMSRGGRLRGLARGGAGSGSQRLSGQLDFGSQQVCYGVGLICICGFGPVYHRLVGAEGIF